MSEENVASDVLPPENYGVITELSTLPNPLPIQPISAWLVRPEHKKTPP
jgi:hypothetical protein